MKKEGNKWSIYNTGKEGKGEGNVYGGSGPKLSESQESKK